MNASAPGGRRAADRLVALAVPLAAAAAAGLLLGHAANLFVLDERVVQLRASVEGTVWTWAASMATLAAGLGAGLLGFLTGRRAPLALLVLLAFFAVDDFVEIHERLGVEAADAVAVPTWIGPRVWALVYLPLLGLALLLGWTVGRGLDRPVRRLLALGAALLATGVVLEVGGVATKKIEEEQGRRTPHELRAGFEEAAELAGWILVAAGLSAGAVAAASSSPRAPAGRAQVRRP